MQTILQILLICATIMGGLGWLMNYLDKKFDQFNKSLKQVGDRLDRSVGQLEQKIAQKVSQETCCERRKQYVESTQFLKQSANLSDTLKDIKKFLEKK